MEGLGPGNKRSLWDWYDIAKDILIGIVSGIISAVLTSILWKCMKCVTASLNIINKQPENPDPVPTPNLPPAGQEGTPQSSTPSELGRARSLAGVPGSLSSLSGIIVMQPDQNPDAAPPPNPLPAGQQYSMNKAG
jgi:hypothetical protein